MTVLPQETSERAIAAKSGDGSSAELAGLFEISQALLSPSGVDAALATVVQCLESSFALRNVLVVLFSTDAPYRLYGRQDEVAMRGYYDETASRVVARVRETRQSVPLHEEKENRLCENCDPVHGDPLCHFIGVPIWQREELVGVITAESSETGPETPGTARLVGFLSGVARLVGQTFQFQETVARDRKHLMEEGRRAQKQFGTGESSRGVVGEAGIVGESRVIQEVLRKIHIVAKSHLPVLLRGESGTGKELFAQAIHLFSPRRDGPMVKLNCAALPETMLESEIFGHEKGAFTGAISQRKGRFELADGGTLFLDEIGEISANFQAKLLRVLQEGEFERVGGSETIKVDVRLVAATNRDLEEGVRKGEFRSDLYFRLCVVPIMLAPLRERAEDIPLLAQEFLRRYNDVQGTSLRFDSGALTLMKSCAFPGNIRELESCVRRTAAFTDGTTIREGDFACRNDSCLSSLLLQPRQRGLSGVGFHPLPILPTAAPAHDDAASTFDSKFDSDFDSELDSEIDSEYSRVSDQDSPERHRLMDAMERAGWVQAKAARLLGLTPRQVCYALRKHGIEVKKF